jgi:hypothetical protein
MRDILIALADILAAKARLALAFLAGFWVILFVNLAAGGAGAMTLTLVALVGVLTVAFAWALVAFWRRVCDLVETDER